VAIGSGRRGTHVSCAMSLKRETEAAKRRGADAEDNEEGPMDMRGCAATPRRPSGHLQKQNGYPASRHSRQMATEPRPSAVPGFCRPRSRTRTRGIIRSAFLALPAGAIVALPGPGSRIVPRR